MSRFWTRSPRKGGYDGEQPQGFALPPSPVLHHPTPIRGGTAANKLRRADQVGDLRAHAGPHVPLSQLITPDNDREIRSHGVFRLPTFRQVARNISQGLMGSSNQTRPLTGLENPLLQSGESFRTIDKEYSYGSNQEPALRNSASTSPIKDLGDGGLTYTGLAQMRQVLGDVQSSGHYQLSGTANAGHFTDSGQFTQAEMMAPPMRPVLPPSSTNKCVGRGDPTKKPRPPPLKLDQPVHAQARREDIHTYTSAGLTLALYNIFPPGEVPADLVAALASPTDLAELLKTQHVDLKAYHNRLAELHNEVGSLKLEVKILEEDQESLKAAHDVELGEKDAELDEKLEDKDVDIARIHSDYTASFAENQRLKKLVQYLVNIIPEDKKLEAVAAAGGLDLNMVSIMDGHEKEGEVKAAVRDLKKVEADVKYWRARAKAAEEHDETMKEA